MNEPAGMPSLPHDPSASSVASPARLPRAVVWVVVAACLLPSPLSWFGVDFGVSAARDAATPDLTGRFVHTLLEWSAVGTGAIVALMAFSHFAVTRDTVTPILGIAFLCSGTMDAFHTLAADELIDVVADRESLVPFTWALSRLFNVLILTVGAGLFLMRGTAAALTHKRAPRLVLGLSVLFGVVAWALIHLCATSENLPLTLHPDAWIPRPWDVAPLMLFIIAGLFVFPRFHRAHPSVFSHALLVSTLPAVATQLHMTFGSTALYDAHFNVAHGLKVLAYGVPLVGLLLDYGRTQRDLLARIEDVDKAQAALRRSEAPMRTLYESNIIAIMLADIHGNIFDANDAFLSLVGYERDELPMRWLDLTPPEWLARDEEAIEQCHARGVVPVWEKEYLHKDGTRIPIMLAVAMLDMEAGTCICPILDLSERSRLEKAVLEQSETERRRLAQNLHDGLGQHLTGMAFLARALELNLERGGPQRQGEAGRLRKLAEQAVTMARTMAEVVCPADLETDGLGPALTRLATNIETVFGVHCSYSHDESVAVRDDSTATHLYHIAQEAITNAIKHGKAGQIEVAMSSDGDELQLSITDDGVGMPADLDGRSGMGLGIMLHRARMIGATLQHGSGPGGGTRVVCRIPHVVIIT